MWALTQRSSGALGCDAWASTAAAHAAAAALLLPGELAEVLDQSIAQLHAKHARLRARKGECCTPEGGRGGAGGESRGAKEAQPAPAQVLIVARVHPLS